MVLGARSKFGVPMFETKVFQKQMYCIEDIRVPVTLLGLLSVSSSQSAHPAVIRRPHTVTRLPGNPPYSDPAPHTVTRFPGKPPYSDPAPGEVTLLSPSLHP